MHIWGEFIVSLWNTGVIDSVVDILMEIWGVLQVLWPVLWVMFCPGICEVLPFFNASYNLTIKFIDAGYSLVYLFL